MSVFEIKTETERMRDKGRTRQRSKASLTMAVQHRPSAACGYVMNTLWRARTCRGSSVRAAVIKYPIYHCHLSALPAGTETT